MRILKYVIAALPFISHSGASYHVDLNMESIVTAIRQLFGFVTGVKPKFRAHGGSNAENLALQNIQVGQLLCLVTVLLLFE